MIEGELTLDILREAIAKIETFEDDNGVVGFKVHPADLRGIEDGTMQYCGIVNNSLIMMPPYEALRLLPDMNQPRGYAEPIRRKLNAIKQRH